MGYFNFQKNHIGLFSLMLVFFASIQSIHSQCTVTVSPATTTIACGQSVDLTAIGVANYIPIYSNDFNTGTVGTGWQTPPSSTVYNNPCGPGPAGSGSHVWFGASSPQPRLLQSVPYDLRCGGRVCFDMKYATQPDVTNVTYPADCEGPDLPEEGVHLQYSTDGVTWTDVQYWDPSPGTGTPYLNWANYCVVLPPGAMSLNTQIRWYQDLGSGAANDHWGIDNVVIYTNNCSFTSTWSNGTSGSNTTTVSPSSTTTYTVTYSDGSVSCTATATVNVLSPIITASATPLSICTGQTSQLDAVVSNTNLKPTTCGISTAGAIGTPSTLTVGTATTTMSTGSTPQPFESWNAVTARMQMLYLKSELPVGTTAGQINSIAFYVNSIPAGALATFQNYTIKLGCTTTAAYASGFVAPLGGLSTVYNSKPMTLVVGWNTFNFDQAYNWDGTSNIVVDICWANSTNGSTGIPVRYTNTAFRSVFYGDSPFTPDNYCGSTATEPSDTERPNIQFGYYDSIMNTSTWTYSWTPTTGLSNPNIKNPVASPTTTTTYTVTYTGGACAPSDDQQITVVVTPPPTVTPITYCQNDVASPLTATGSGLLWYTAATGGVGSATAPTPSTTTVGTTNYYVSQTVSGCEGARANLVVTVTAGITPTFTPLAPICSGGTAPTLPAFSNDTPPISGTWATLPTNNTTTTTYTFTPDPGQCATTQTLIQTVNTGATNVVKNITNASCGASNGAVTFGAVTGGTPGYTISFNGGGFGPTTTSYTGLAPGTYPVIVEDANGCQYNTTVIITDQPGPTNIAHVETNSTCGNANGSTALGTVTGGTPPYEYDFNGTGYPASATTYTGLAAGTYTLNVKDANGCIHSTTVTISDTPGPTNIAWTFVDAACGTPNGSVTLGTVTGGTPGYDYNFNGLGFSTTTTYGGLAAGGYPLIVRDANGCLWNTTVPISNSGGPTNIAHVEVQSTCGLANGSTTLGTVTGGTAPFTYNFNNTGYPASATFYGGLAAGSYPLEVKDANGCIYTTTVVIIDAPGVTDIATTVVDATCGLANGTVTLGTVTGGTPPYEYDFDGSGYTTTSFYGGLAAGSYVLNVKDANGCIYTENVTVIDLPGPTAIASVIVNENCGQADGSVTFGAVTGGASPYTHNFNNTGYPGTATYTGLAAGVYPIEVTDSNGCKFNDTITITNSAAITDIVTTTVDATCGAATGSVTLGAVTGGTPTYEYDFNNTGYPGSSSYTGLAAGSYVLNVRDANGCIYTETVIINDVPGPTGIITSIIDETCGAADGSVTITSVTGGTPPYEYNFDNMGYPGSTSYTGLSAGSYPLEVKDANGCTYSTTITINNSGGPTNIAHTEVNSTCGNPNGSTTLGTVTGGATPYEYDFNNTGYPGSTSYTGLAAGVYTLNVKDANGCVYPTTVTITDSPGITNIASVVVDETCGSANGTVTLGTVTGGTAPYEYNFDNTGYPGSTSYTGLSAGSYPLEVKDANGCTYTTTITVSNVPGPTGIVITPTDAACGASDGAVTLGAVTGGTPPYVYDFNGTGYPASATTYTGLAAGSYPLNVKDANGCIYPTVVSISNAGGPTDIVITPTGATCGNANGSVTLGAVTGGTMPYEYNFNNTGYPGSTSYTGLVAGTYGVLVRDASGCIYSESVVITDTPGPTDIVVTVVDSTCGAANGSVSLGAVTGGTMPYEYDFNGTGYPGSTSYTGLSAGTYSLNVKDANGCIYSAPAITINTTPAPTVSISYATSPFCVNTVIGQSVTITGTGTYTGGTYSSTAGLTINPTTGAITPNTSTPGTYTVNYDIPATGGCPPINTNTSVTINPELAPVITCGTLSTTSVQFNWGTVPGAAGYSVSYQVGANPSVNVGPLGNVLTYTVNTGVNPGDTVVITVTPTGGAGACLKSASLPCTASACVASSITISYATPFCESNATPQAVNAVGTGTYTGGTYSATPTGLIINSGTGAITPQGSTPGTYTVTYLLVGTGGCPNVTDTATVTITLEPTANINYSSSPFCTSNTSPQGVSLSGGTGAYTGGTYSATPTPGLTINSSTGAITPSTSTAGTYTVTYTIAANGGCPAVPVTTTVTVTAAPTATISYASASFCTSDTAQPVTIIGTGAYTGGTYSAPGGLTINTSTGAITPGTSTAGTYVVTYTIAASAGCSTATATTSVTINALPVAMATPPFETICSGSTTGIVLSSSMPGTTYSWTVVQNNVTGATAGSGSTIAQTLTAIGTGATATYTITPTANGCAGNPITVVITVNEAPIATATPASQAICSGQSTGITLTSSINPGTTYSWTFSQSGGATGASNGTGNVISQVLTTTGPGLGTVTYTITPTGSTCVGPPITVTISVTPPPTATATTTTNAICSGETTNIVLTGSIPGTTFTWNVVQTNILGGSNGSGNVIAQTLNTVGTSQGEAVYVITPSMNGCPGAPITVSIIVKPNPTVTANPTMEILCSGETTGISLSSNVPGTTFSWTALASFGISGANAGTGNFIAQTLFMTGSTQGTVDYDITAMANGCPGNTTRVTVTVKPKPEAFGSPGGTICSGDTTAINLTPSIPGTSFTWTVVQTGVTGATPGTGSAINQILETTGTAAGLATYTIIPTANGCDGDPIIITVMVNPLPAPTLTDGIVCVDAAGNSFSTYTLDTGLNNSDYDFVWFLDNVIVPGAVNNTYAASEPGIYSVEVTNSVTGCVFASGQVTATVIGSYPGTDMTLTASDAFTYNPTITVDVIPTPNPDYLYSLDDGPLQESNIFSPVSPGNHTVKVTDVNGCTDLEEDIFVIGYPLYFTPNGDGVNDTWNIIGLKDPSTKIYIFDRYGKLVKQISPTGSGWDGFYNGELLPSTDYWFTIDYMENGGTKLFKAHFSLRR